ncbi:ABC transporter ATP-binding protein [Rhizobium paknamense]|uniref:Branched-chain amino acid transport system ATP-binding protein n=1 Tax=Rhizobium paknamense TaxID=1206817 RepID=A0ABU0IEZ8_9HYPH|nr:ABC transporter ATP-binding protein [Rhizobium paknamense]MDQ0456795.1 branched-chain amino acid transport system ATP-binding protein [Rhizobium paknamense]
MTDLLEIESLSAGYGRAVVLQKVSFTLAQGQAMALLGRNGVGKTTTLNSLIGLTRFHSGRVLLNGQDMSRLSPERRVEAGIGWVPQERGIFRSLTVEENITASARPGRWTLEAVYELFPRLKERRRNFGNQLSGGEQQMLSIGRALALNPKILLLDEPTEGLAPIIVEELLASIRRIVREEGLAAIIVEQHAQQILAMTERAVILDRGAVAHSGDSAALAADTETLGRFLGIGT